MLSNAFNIAKARRWQETRRRIRSASGAARLRLLQSFGEAPRVVPSLFGAVIGAWLNLDPANPQWPGRDRLYVPSPEGRAAACAVLAACGFLPPEKIPDYLAEIDIDGRDAFVPGLEAPGVPPEEIPQLLWESATASARDKRRWREAAATFGHDSWFAPSWRAATETWRSCIVLNASDAVAAACRDLARRRDEPAAGLVALVRAPEVSAPDVIEEWADAGWKAVLVNGEDCLQLHDVLAGAKLDTPLAAVLGIPPAREAEVKKTRAEMPAEPEPAPPSPAEKAQARRRECELLGELSDEQFNALFDESLNT